MIEYKTGNILTEDTEALVNTVNCVGIMGRGLALQFKKTYPDNYNAYKKACNRKEIQPGKMFVFGITGSIRPQYIINFPTKQHWRGSSKLEDIKIGLQALAEELEQRKIHSVAIPPLGCGLGGLAWNDVKELIEASLGSSNTKVIVYQPQTNVANLKSTQNSTPLT